MIERRGRDTLRLRVAVNHVASIVALVVAILVYVQLDGVNERREQDRRAKVGLALHVVRSGLQERPDGVEARTAAVEVDCAVRP